MAVIELQLNSALTLMLHGLNFLNNKNWGDFPKENEDRNYYNVNGSFLSVPIVY